MLLSGCKKYTDFSAINFEITSDEFVVTTPTTATLSADYSWPGKVVSIAMEVSEDEGFANAMSFEASVSGNSLTVTANGLKAETTYYYRIITDTGYGIVESDTRTFETNNPNTFTVNGVIFEMVYVEGGTFDMGATTEQGSDAESDEKPVHSVTLDGYYIGKCEVTQELWEAVMGSNPSNSMGAQKPVESVSWNDCKNFIKKLSSLTGRTFRLPTEAEWEYAARGGNKSRHYKYSGSGNIGYVAWYDGNSGYYGTHAVGTKSPNELGIYDMSGNVWEWCSDWYGDYSAGTQTNPQGPSSGSGRVLRGGGWNGIARNCRVSFRSGYAPDYSRSSYGLRLVLVP